MELNPFTRTISLHFYQFYKALDENEKADEVLEKVFNDRSLLIPTVVHNFDKEDLYFYLSALKKFWAKKKQLNHHGPTSIVDCNEYVNSAFIAGMFHNAKYAKKRVIFDEQNQLIPVQKINSQRVLLRKILPRPARNAHSKNCLHCNVGNF